MGINEKICVFSVVACVLAALLAAQLNRLVRMLRKARACRLWDESEICDSKLEVVRIDDVYFSLRIWYAYVYQGVRYESKMGFVGNAFDRVTAKELKAIENALQEKVCRVDRIHPHNSVLICEIGLSSIQTFVSLLFATIVIAGFVFILLFGMPRRFGSSPIYIPSTILLRSYLAFNSLQPTFLLK